MPLYGRGRRVGVHQALQLDRFSLQDAAGALFVALALLLAAQVEADDGRVCGEKGERLGVSGIKVFSFGRRSDLVSFLFRRAFLGRRGEATACVCVLNSHEKEEEDDDDEEEEEKSSPFPREEKKFS